ncbi:signal recognition particle-docking protein FtsY [Desulfonatronum lacustre]|uniref:signal recognition particle-docking protein FtsY n=1 Tax=Desulfonatronum lacustre TaxID=66849 RepID=UPI00048EFF6A|nr:signal recognition particle-docking protein FtsY [Desulfonatronum lacustre]
MGFFSKVKKWWSTEEATKTEESIEQPEPKPSQESSEASDSAEIVDQAVPADQEPTTPAPEPEPVEPSPEPVAEHTPEDASELESRSEEEEKRPTGPESIQPPLETATQVVPDSHPEPRLKTGPEPVAEPASGAAPEATSGPVPESVFEPSPEPAFESQEQPASKARPGLLSRLFSRQPAKPTPSPEPEPTSKPEQLVETAPAKPSEPGRATEATAKAPEWQTQVMQALRGAEPKLSVWLEHTLSGVETMGDELWERLRFLFRALEAPEDEAELFITKFRDWLEDMGYEQVAEFRSELQYRLALALELEDEEDERDRLFLKLSEGLNKTREQLTKRIDALLSAHRKFDDPFWEELEEVLIMADVGHRSAVMLLDRLKARVRKEDISEPEAFREMLRQELAAIFPQPKVVDLPQGPEVVLVVGVNGVGKTTTIAKLAHRAQMQGRKVLVAAGDTFRAAAMEQLAIWAKRTGADFFSKGEGADPAAVAYEAVDAALQGGHDVVFLDTAGRLHTKVDLMDELRKIKRVLAKKLPGAPHRSLLVVDATTGQNALSQTKLFHEAVSVDEIILTKLDGTSKGGIVVAIALEFGMPISFVGLGEKMEDLRPFSGEDFAKALVN